MFKKLTLWSLFLMAACCICSYSFAKKEKRMNVLATTYPVYNFTKIVTYGEKNIDVKLLLSASMGCPHDYAVTPQDLKKIAGADVLVINGLGMEEFLGDQIHQVNPKLELVDSSEEIHHILYYREEETAESKAEDHHHQPAAREHHHHGLNPHLFASPKMAAQLTTTIASQLSKVMPESEVRFKKNAKQFASRMDLLVKDFTKVTRHLKNNRIVAQQGAFDYLARDIGLKVVAVIESHAGQEPSAAQMMKLIKIVKEKHPGAIVTQPQYSPKVAHTIGQETGLPVIVLDPVASGPIPVKLDYYEKTMRKNMKILEQTLGR